MVRETRHLWVGNLPDNVREDRIRDHFERYGRVQNVKLLASGAEGAGGGGGAGLCAAVAFIDIMSAAKAQVAKHTLDDRPLTTVYYEPALHHHHQQPPEAPEPDAAPGAAPAPGAPATGSSASSGSTVGSSGTPGYATQSSTERARPRDRLYRNGPTSYTNSSIVDRNAHQRWYNNYGTSPTATSENLGITTGVTEGSTRGRRRGRSGSSSGSGSSSRSVSSSSAGRSASSSSSRASSPSADHRRKPQCNGNSGRPLAICVRNLPQRSSDSSLKDGLFHEYKKHGKVSCVKVVGVNQDRYAVVCFKKSSDVEKALEVSQNKSFFGCKISVGPYQGMDVEDNESRPYETDLDEFHPKATRTLFIGNLEKDVTAAQLREKFKHFGKIIEIDIKKQSGSSAGYAFCQYANISSVVDAIRRMDGEHVGGSRVKLGFGKSMATSCIWIDGITESSEKQVFAHCARIGPVSQYSTCNGSGHALVVFEQVASAQQAVKELRGLSVKGRKLQVDFASRECQDDFYEQREKQCTNSTSNDVVRNTADSRFSELPLRSFDSSNPAKYNRYESSPRARQTSSSSYSRSRGTRFFSQNSGEHFDAVNDFSERRFRYEDFSGGSGSEAAYDPATNNPVISGTPALQSVVVVSSPASCPTIPPPPLAPNMRHLKKERVHLLEQLEECPSSGDELVSPKKRFKSERSSLGRRPSAETSNRHHRDISPSIKRRRGSEASRHHWHTPSPVSRPGTPLHDERPDSPVPTEPRRLPLARRSVPMCLPLPRFAAQILQRSSHISPPYVPSGPPPPASPTTHRIPSPASSPGSSPSPAEPSLDERIRSLDEKYEKWSGSRTTTHPECPERSRFRHHLLDLDVTEVQPSEVMRSVLAKHSVFDEDSKRLESICDKYDTTPIRTTCPYPSPSGTRVSPSPLNSPQSAGRSPYSGSPSVCPVKAVPPAAPPPPATPAKGLQYPFPSHPPIVSASPLDSATSLSTSLPSENSDDISKGLFSERPSVTHVESINIPRSLSNSNERVPVSLGFNSEIPSVLTTSAQTGIIPKTLSRSVSLKSETCVLKQSEHKSPQNKDINSASNVNDLDVVGEGDIKTKCGVVNNDNLDRRKFENVDSVSQKLDPDLSVKDQSFKSKVSSEKLQDKRINEKSTINSNSLLNDNKVLSDLSRHETRKQNSSDDKEKRKLKEEKLSRLFCDRKLDSDRKKREENIEKVDFVDPFMKPINEKTIPNCFDKFGNSNDSSEKENNAGKERLESERREREQLEKEKAEKERVEKERKEKEKIERERLDKDRREKDRLEQVEKERIEKELIEKERREKEKLERERREKEKLEKERKEKERIIKEKLEKEKVDKDRSDRDKHEKIERISENKTEKHEKKKDRDKEFKKKEEKDLTDFNDSLVPHKERKREKDDHSSDSRHRHRDSHKKDHDKSDSKKESSSKSHESSRHKDANRKPSKDEPSREIVRKDSCDSSASRNSNDSNKSKDHENNEFKDDFRYKNNKVENHKNRHHDKEFSPKSTVKIEPEIRSESKRDKLPTIESDKPHSDTVSKDKRLNIDDKQRHYSFDSHSDHRNHEAKRKERLNSSCSLPASVGLKRRVSSLDNLDHEDTKKPKLNPDCKKLPERRDSKDSNRHLDKSKHSKIIKNNISKQLEEKIRDDKKSNRDSEEKHKVKDFKERDMSEKENFEKSIKEKDVNDDHDMKDKEIRDMNKLKLNEKLKNRKKDIENDGIKSETVISDMMTKERDLSIDKEFLERLELRSSQEDEKQQALKKEMKEKKRQQQLQQIQLLKIQQQSALQHQEERKNKCDDRKKEIKEKRISTERKSREENTAPKLENIRKKSRKFTNSTDTSDSDEPKKHSIFDIVDEGPTYISMYDKVKARSCKNMQKQEEEKRQEKIKAKFSQLKQSRAKREEKKRSTSWDEDSDSDRDNKKSTSKSLIASSSEDEFRRRHRENMTTDSENDLEKFKITQKKLMEICDGDSTDDARNKLISRKNSRSRITSDTSDDETMKRVLDKSNNFSSSDRNNLDSKKHIKKEHIEVKLEPSDNSYGDKHSKPNNKSHYDNNSSIKSIMDGKKIINDMENDYIKRENYIKNEPIFKYNSNYSDIEYDTYPEEVIISDSGKSKSGSDTRRKHRKKQKRQRSYPSDEENGIIYDKSSANHFDAKLNCIKRKHNNKKDKKRDRIKIEDFVNLKPKKLKKTIEPTTESRSESIKRDEIMQDIFGPLSDCDDKVQNDYKTMYNKHNEESKESNLKVDLFSVSEKPNNFYETKTSVSAPEPDIFDLYTKSNLDSNVSPKDQFKDDIKKRREKKRKERKSVHKDDDNSLDVDAAGKAIEASLCAEALSDTKRASEKPEIPLSISKTPLESDVFRFTDGDDSRESSLISSTKNINHIKKEIKEKRKKKKKSKDERQNRKDHHHHHHRERSSIDIDLKNQVDLFEIPSGEETTDKPPVTECKPALPSPSLPRLTESPTLSKDVEVICSSPVEIIDSPTSSNSGKSSDIRHSTETFIPGFSIEIDDTISENAVKSISDFDKPISERKDAVDNKIKTSLDCEVPKSEEKIDEKPRAIISQEETEDAVAALLGESFGSRNSDFDSCYNETDSPDTHVDTVAPEITDNIPDEEAEEMRQAVQSLNAAEIEMKPETPQSENDLQIDTDTDEADDTKVEPQKSHNNSNVQHPKAQLKLQYQTQPTAIVENSLPALSDSNPAKDLKLSIKDDSVEEPLKIVSNDMPAAPSKIIDSTEVAPPTPTVISKGWSLKSNDQPLLIATNPVTSRDEKPVHITTSILHIKPLNVAGSCKPILATSTKVPGSYQVINQIPRPNTLFNAQPPTIKIPEQHVIYQRQPSIMISPRTREIRLHPTKQHPEMQSKVANVKILTTGPPPNLTSPPRLTSNLQHRSPGQITVVRMQQPPLSPIQTSHIPPGHQNRQMLSPNHHNTVVIQNQNSPMQLNCLPLTPVLTPITKPLIGNNLNSPQSKAQMSTGNSNIIQSSKLISGADLHNIDVKVSHEPLMSNPKPLFQPSNIASTQNPVVVHNRIPTISSANQNIPSPILVPSHILNKTGLNTSIISDKTNETMNIINGPDQNKTATVLQTFNPQQQIHIQPNGQVIQTVPKGFVPEMTNTVKQISTIQSLPHQAGIPRFTAPTVVTNMVQIEQKPSVLSPTISKTQNPTIFTVTKPTVLNIVEKSPGIQIIQSLSPNSRPVIKSVDSDGTLEKNINTNGKLDISDKKSTEPEDKPKCETDFEELLKPTAIVTKIEKPANLGTNNNLVVAIHENKPDIVKNEPNIDIVKKEIEVIPKEEVIKNEPIPIDHKINIDSKEDPDNWSASDVNIDSVIKKVDALCSTNTTPGDAVVEKNNETDLQKTNEGKSAPDIDATTNQNSSSVVDLNEDVNSKTTAKRGGRSRGRKIQERIPERVQTRQGIKSRGTTPILTKRGGRGGRLKTDRSSKTTPIMPSNEPGDIYDFHEDSGDEVGDSQNKNEPRPRLILTIKGPATASNVAPALSPVPTPQKDPNASSKTLPTSPSALPIKDDKSDDFVPPSLNTRKSRRLQEKDVTRNSVDDVIEDVVKNSSLPNRTGVINKDSGPIRRSTRQNTVKVPEKNNSDLRKSPRGGKKPKDRRSSETSVDSSDEKPIKKETSETFEEVAKNPDNTNKVKKIETEDQVLSDKLVDGSLIKKKSQVDSDNQALPNHIDEPILNKDVVVKKAEQELPPVDILKEEPAKSIIVNPASVASPKVIISKLADDCIKVTTDNPEELMLDPVTGELVYMRHNDEGNFVPINEGLKKSDSVVIAPKASSNIRSTTEVKSSILPVQSSCITVGTATQIPITETAMATSIVKTLPATAMPQKLPNASSNIGAVQSPTIVIADSKITNPPSVISSGSNIIHHSSPSIPSNVISRTPGSNIHVPLNQPGKGHVITSVSASLPKSQVIIGKPPSTIQPNIPLSIKTGLTSGLPPHNVPVNKILCSGPSSPRLQQNLVTKVPPGQQLKTIPMQPQIAHPPLKVQGLIGQPGALGPGNLGPNLPKGAQHSSPPLLVAKHMSFAGPQPVIAGASSSRVNLTPIPSISPQGQPPLHTDMLGTRSPPPAHQQTSPITPGDGVYSQFTHQQYQYFRTHPEARATPSPYVARSPHGAEGSEAPSPPLELRRPPCARVPHPAHSPSLSDRSTDSPQIAQVYSMSRPSSRPYLDAPSMSDNPNGGRYYESPAPPPAHVPRIHHPIPPAHHRILEPPVPAMPKMSITQGPGLGINIGGTVGEERGPSRGCAPAQGSIGQSQSPPGPPHASHAPREADSLMMLLRRYPVMWQGLLALKNDAAAVQMHFVHGNPAVAGQTLPCNGDGSTAPLRIAQRMRLEPVQLEAVARKMQMEHEHCMLLALPCGRDHLDVLQQSTHLTGGFITYLRRKQAAGIVNVAPPGHHQALFTVHIFPSCDFANENLERIAPDLLHRVADIAHLLIVIATV